jgi:hypothetical protein
MRNTNNNVERFPIDRHVYSGIRVSFCLESSSFSVVSVKVVSFQVVRDSVQVEMRSS